jgi:hypothetical protein
MAPKVNDVAVLEQPISISFPVLLHYLQPVPVNLYQMLYLAHICKGYAVLELCGWNVLNGGDAK